MQSYNDCMTCWSFGGGFPKAFSSLLVIWRCFLAVCWRQVVGSYTWTVFKHPLLGGIRHLLKCLEGIHRSPLAGRSCILGALQAGSRVASCVGRELDKVGSLDQPPCTGPVLVLCCRILDCFLKNVRK